MYIATTRDLIDYYNPRVTAAGVVLKDYQTGCRLPVRYNLPKTFLLDFKKDREGFGGEFILKESTSALIPDLLRSLNRDPIDPKNILDGIFGVDNTYNDPVEAVVQLNAIYADMIAKNNLNAFTIAMRDILYSKKPLAISLYNATIFQRTVGNLIQVYLYVPYNLSFTFQAS